MSRHVVEAKPVERAPAPLSVENSGAERSNAQNHDQSEIGTPAREFFPVKNVFSLSPSHASSSLLRLQRTHGNRYVQRMLALARQENGEAEVTPEVESTIERARGGGQGLDHGVRREMESAFANDFGGVRVHTGSQSHELNKSVNAVAFTTGRDIFFSDGAYSPGSAEGKELLAHELTHVVQQGGSTPISGKAQRFQIQRMCSECEEEKKKNVQGKLRVGQPDDKYEQQAEQVAREVMAISRASGGESEQGEEVGDPNALVGGESATLQRDGGTDAGTDAGTSVSQDAGTGGGADAGVTPALSFSTVSPVTNQSCGGFSWGVRWGLAGASASTNGFIVQQVTFDLAREVCAGGRDDFTKTYWEAWQVRNGSIFVGTSNTAHNADTFAVPPATGEKGVTRLEGSAKFIPGYTEPLTWGNVPEARSLPATTRQPAGWSTGGTISRGLRNEFDCCNQTDLGTFTHFGG